MRKIIFIILLLGVVSAYLLLVSYAPARFPQLAEYRIAGAGSYDNPQWSSDSRYLAFFDDHAAALTIFDTQTKASWNVGTQVSGKPFNWTPDNRLTYLRYRPDRSGMPYPIISDLHEVDLDGGNDWVIASNLSDAGDFVWLSSNRLAILLTDPAINTYFNDLNVYDLAAQSATLLVKSQTLNFQYVSALNLAADGNTLLIVGFRQDADRPVVEYVTYDLETQTVLNRFEPSQIIPSGGIKYPIPATSDDENVGWVSAANNRWILASVNTPGGVCYNYALFFFDSGNLQNSFCIPTVQGIVTAPTISPDQSKLSYITVEGPGADYVMIGTVTPDLMNRLK